LSTKRVIDLIGTEKSCPILVEINSNSIDGQTRPLAYQDRAICGSLFRYFRSKLYRSTDRHDPECSLVTHNPSPQTNSLLAQTIVAPCSRVRVSIFVHVYASYDYTHTMFTFKCSILCAPTPPLCAFFHHVCIRIYVIHLKTCSCVNVYTKTVQLI